MKAACEADGSTDGFLFFLPFISISEHSLVDSVNRHNFSRFGWQTIQSVSHFFHSDALQILLRRAGAFVSKDGLNHPQTLSLVEESGSR